MAVDLGAITLIGQERTCAVYRSLPATGKYQITIEREILYKDAAGGIGARSMLSPALVLSVQHLLASEAARVYLQNCNSAKSLYELIQAESALYDGLVAEQKAAEALATDNYLKQAQAAAAAAAAQQAEVIAIQEIQRAAALLVQQRAAEAAIAAANAGG